MQGTGLDGRVSEESEEMRGHRIEKSTRWEESDREEGWLCVSAKKGGTEGQSYCIQPIMESYDTLL